MYLQSLATAVPEYRCTQQECWEILRGSSSVEPLNKRSLAIIKKILTGNSGIASRYFSVKEINDLFSCSSDQLHEIFAEHAPVLAGKALSEAMEKAGIHPAELDALLVCTCTGYLCPGVSSYVAENLGLRENVFLQDLVGLGCGAAIPVLRVASALAEQSPDSRIATVAVEICSAAFYLDDDPGVLVSACLFGDGAAACIWSGEGDSSQWRAENFDTIHLPQHRELLRFERKDGYLRNKLHRTVPQKAAVAVGALFNRRSDPSSIPKVLCHPGGRDVLQGLRECLPGQDLEESEWVLRNYGNMSSPSVLFALKEALKNPDGIEGSLWMVGFGAGFSAHSMDLRRTP